MFSARDVCFDGKVVGNVVKCRFFIAIITFCLSCGYWWRVSFLRISLEKLYILRWNGEVITMYVAITNGIIQ